MKVENKKIIDVCCGGRMFWFDKNHPATVYMDQRVVKPTKLSNGAMFSVNPDVVADFRNIPFDDESFALIAFDPPHIVNAGETSRLANKYGYLKKETWKDDLRKGFEECFRVLKKDGVLIFKWNEWHIPTKDILALTQFRPLFGNRSGKASKTHWIVFMK